MLFKTKKSFFFFLRDERAVTSVEFAIISPLIIVLIFALFELSLLGLAQSAINTLSRDIARLNVTSNFNASDANYTQEIQNRTTAINNLAMTSLAGLFDTNTFRCDTNVVNGFVDAPPLDPNIVSTQYGTANSIVVYRLSANHNFILPAFALILGGSVSNVVFKGQNSINLTAQLVVRNEPS